MLLLVDSGFRSTRVGSAAAAAVAGAPCAVPACAVLPLT